MTGDRGVEAVFNDLLTACFTVADDATGGPPQAGQSFTVDFSCSTGSIVQYDFYLVWGGNPLQQPSQSGPDTTYTTIYEAAGCFDSRLVVHDNSSNQAEVIREVCVQ